MPKAQGTNPVPREVDREVMWSHQQRPCIFCYALKLPLSSLRIDQKQYPPNGTHTKLPQPGVKQPLKPFSYFDSQMPFAFSTPVQLHY